MKDFAVHIRNAILQCVSDIESTMQLLHLNEFQVFRKGIVRNENQLFRYYPTQDSEPVSLVHLDQSTLLSISNQLKNKLKNHLT